MSAAVTREPGVYRPDGEHSFFADMAKASRRDVDAARRLFEHEEQETRAVNTTAGTAGEFTTPWWVIEEFQTVARAGRVLGDLCNQIELPPGVSSVNWPIITAGADTAVQPGQPDPVTEVDQVTASAVNTSIVTIAGEVDASQQLFDLTPNPPGYDGIVYTDLTRAYNQNLEKQLLNGSGINGQLTGVQVVTGRNADIVGTTATSISVSWNLMGQALAAVGNNRLMPAEYLLMAPRRWAWLTASVDSQGRPIDTPSIPLLSSDGNVMAGGTTAAGRILEKPVYEDGAIPAGTSADVIIALRPSDLFLYESPPKFAVHQDVLSGTLQVRLTLNRYACFLIPYPKSIVVITGIPQPASY